MMDDVERAVKEIYPKEYEAAKKNVTKV